MVIEFIASEEAYLDHLAPVFHELQQRGEECVFRVLRRLLPHANRRGVDVIPIQIGQDRPPSLMVVSSQVDLLRGYEKGRPIVRMEHGIGMTYENDPWASYPGGPGQKGVVAFVSPNWKAATRWGANYSDIVTYVAGIPRLDKWKPKPKSPWSTGHNPVVCISFHWDCRMNSETRWAFPYYREALSSLRTKLTPGIRLIGHSHPRARFQVRPVFEEAGIEFVEDFEIVLELADAYLCDTSSTIYEFAATGRPVGFLNAPYYRRDINHGIRFWDHTGIGPHCNHPEALASTIKLTLSDLSVYHEPRRLAAEEITPYIGQATSRAADAILQVKQRLSVLST